MNNNHRTSGGELSYYGLSLLSYLQDSHPQLTTDTDFIVDRADRAAEIYSEVIHSGRTHAEAEHAANEELYRGLHFSPYNTLVNILWDEFTADVPEEDARTVARLILPFCGDVLRKYDLSDNFAGTPQYDLLYTELVGTIQIILKDGLQ